MSVCVSSVGSAVGEKGELVLTQLTKEKWGGHKASPPHRARLDRFLADGRWSIILQLVLSGPVPYTTYFSTQRLRQNEPFTVLSLSQEIFGFLVGLKKGGCLCLRM